MKKYLVTQELVNQIKQVVSFNLKPICLDLVFSEQYLKQECKKLEDFIAGIKEPGTEHRVEYNAETKLFEINFVPIKPIKIIEETEYE